jgi:hypothetical protein
MVMILLSGIESVEVSVMLRGDSLPPSASIVLGTVRATERVSTYCFGSSVSAEGLGIDVC